MIGVAPTRDDREVLRQHDLGPVGRTKEKVFEAVSSTRRANRTPLAVLSGRFATASFTGESANATVPVTLSPESKELGVVKGLFGIDGRQAILPDYINSIGFIVDDYSRLDTDRNQAARAKHIGLYAMHDSEPLDAIRLSESDILALPPDLQSGLESLANMAAFEANIAYLDSKPDHTV
jgi:hypothetical protein